MNKAKFFIGQIIQHKLFKYRGVIFGVDDSMQLSDQWYEQVAKSRPPKDKPWYQIMVDGYEHTTYVAERNLLAAEHPKPVKHPLLEDFFDKYEAGKYIQYPGHYH